MVVYLMLYINNNLNIIIYAIMQYQIQMQQHGHFKQNKMAVRLRLRKNTHNDPTHKKTKNEGLVSGKLKQQNNILNENINKLSTIKGSDMSISKYVQSISNAYQQRIKDKNQVIGLLVSKLRQVFKQLYAQAETISKHIQKDKTQLKQTKYVDIGDDNHLKQTPNRQARVQDMNWGIDSKNIINKNPSQIMPQTYDSALTSAYKNTGIQSTIVNTQSCINPSTQRNLDIQQYQQQQQSNSLQNVLRINAELRSQAQEMEHYIITLKEQLNEKERIIDELEEDKVEFKNMCEEMAQLLKEQEQRCKILEEEISGYVQKMDKLEQQTSKIRSRSDLERQRTLYELDPDNRERKHSHIDDRHPHEHDDSGYEQYAQIQQDKLQQIYSKTQQTLKRYHQLQRDMADKQKQCNTLIKVISQIMQYLCLPYNQYSTHPQLSSTITKQIDSRMQQMQQQQQQRQIKLQHMIGEQLDNLLQILSIINVSSSSVNEQQEGECITILDKIHRITWIVESMFKSECKSKQAVLTNNQYFNKLIDYHDRIEDIMGKADAIGSVLLGNTHKLNQILSIQQRQHPQQQHNINNITDNILKLQQLLQLNQQLLTDQNIQLLQYIKLEHNSDGINVKKINNYLQDLENTIKQLYQYKNNNINNSGDIHEICNKQKQLLKEQIKCILNQHSNLIKDTQYVIDKINTIRQYNNNSNNNKLESDLDDLEPDILLLGQTIKASKSIKDKAILIVQPELHQKLIINQQASKIKNKYFPANPDLVDNILNKLIQLKNAKTDHEFSNAIDSIFQSLKTREDKVNQEIGRKKQVVKQRSTAIAQICKRGISDRSFSEDHIPIPDQY